MEIAALTHTYSLPISRDSFLSQIAKKGGRWFGLLEGVEIKIP
jgi:hypothetical protein